MPTKDSGLLIIYNGSPGTLREIFKYLGSGGSMFARMKLKGIDGRAPQGVEPAV